MKLIFKTIALVPRFSAWVIYFILHHIAHHRSNLIAKNIGAFMPEIADQQRFVRDFHREWARNLTEYCVIFAGTTERQVKKCVKFNNAELVHAHLAAGHQVMLVIGHTFNTDWNWQSSGLEFGGDKLYVIGAPQDEGALDEWARQTRDRFGGTVILPTEVGKKLLSGEHRPGVLIFTGDLKPPEDALHQGEITRFLGAQTYMFTSLPYLAHRLGMHIVYQDMQRVGLCRFEVTFTDISPPPLLQDSARIQRAYVAHIENSVRANPVAWWFWSKQILENAPPQPFVDLDKGPAEIKQEN